MSELLDKLKKKFVRECPDLPEYKNRLNRELELLERKNFIDYIIQVCEILELIGNTPHIIRGSSGSSLVCWLVGINIIDPVKNSICFSRFLNEFRSSMPDIDMDFPHNQRKKIFNKIFDKWEGVVRISNYVKYKEKSAIRKVLKDMGVVGKIPKSKCNLNYWTNKEKKEELIKGVKQIKGKFKNYSLHCGGIIFFTDLSKMSKYQIKGRQILLDKVDIESEGFFKIDILANRGLSQLIKIDPKPVDSYDFEDNKTIELFQSGNNIGLTFGESPGMRKIFSILKPKSILDIAKCLALIRPGATKNMPDTIEEFNNDDIIFDDDAIIYIQNLLSCSEDKADCIRRLYAKGNRVEIGQFELELYGKNPELDIDDISAKLINLKKYSFCKSHALSYAYLLWALAYQKAHNPKEFWKSTIKNCSSMYRKWVYIREAICAGVRITCDDSLDSISHFYKYGFWLGPKFIDSNMYVNILNHSTLLCEFRGLIATSKYYKKYNPKIKSYDLLTFITIGYENSIYIDLIIKGWIKTKERNICSGKGKVKLIKDYATICVDTITYN